MTTAQVLEAILEGDLEVLSSYTGLRDPGISTKKRRELALIYTTALRMAAVEDRRGEVLDSDLG